MLSALKGLLQVLKDDATVSSYELQSTGLVTALLRCLYQVTLMNRTLSYLVGHPRSKCSTCQMRDNEILLLITYQLYFLL